MRPLRELFERGQADGDVRDGHPECPADRVAARADRRRVHVGPLPGQGGHDSHDHRPLPRRSPRPRSAPRMNDQDIAARSEDHVMEQDHGDSELLQELVELPPREPHGAARAVGATHQRGRAPPGHVRRGDLLRGDRGPRQLRRRARDRQHRDAPELRPRAVRADHPARRRDRRGARDRPPPARRPGAVAVREVPGRPRSPQPHPRRLRARGEPHRGDRQRLASSRNASGSSRSSRRRCGSCRRRCCSSATAC